MRNTINTHSSLGITIVQKEYPDYKLFGSGLSIDEKWKMLENAIENENQRRKKSFLLREQKFFEIRNGISSNEIHELEKILLLAEDLKSIILRTENYYDEILIFSDNLGNELWLKNFERRAYSNIIEESNVLLDLIRDKIKLLNDERERKEAALINASVAELCPVHLTEKGVRDLNLLISQPTTTIMIDWKPTVSSLVSEMVKFNRKKMLGNSNSHLLDRRDLANFIRTHFNVKRKLITPKTLENCISNAFRKDE